MFRHNCRPGHTLVELMIASALGVLVIAAALTVFNLQRSFHRNADRLLSEESSTSLGVIAITRDLENAGYHFAAPALAIRPRDNISASLPNGDGTVIPAIALGDPGSGVILGTDALEILSGNGSTVSGVVNGASATTTTTSTATVTLDALDPLSANDVDAGSGGYVGPVLVFQNATTRCLGKVTSIVGLSVTVTRFADFEGNLSGAGCPTACPAGCPAAQMSVYAVMSRKRYLIYQESPGVFGLYVQNLRDPAFGNHLGVLGPPVLVVQGVEDLQISWNIGNDTWCNNGTPSDGGADCDVMNNLATIQGLQFQLVSRGDDVVLRPGKYRPAVFNHSAGPQDDIDRLVLGTGVMLRNLAYVGVAP